MQTIKLVIPGLYYDSHIYSGRLYLWDEDGAILILNWDKLVDRIVSKMGEHLKFAAHCALRKGSYLYDNAWQLFVKDIQMFELLMKRFTELAKSPIDLSIDDLNSALIKKQDNPFSFPHADTLIYYHRIFIGGSTGLEVSARTNDISLVKNTETKLWDGPVLSLAANTLNIAIAAGSEGLYEGSLNLQEIQTFTAKQRSAKDSNLVRWLYPSIFSSSYTGGYLADYRIERRSQKLQETKKIQKDRIFLATLTDKDLFGEAMAGKSDVIYSWGVQDKICLATTDSVQIIRFIPETQSNKKPQSYEHLQYLGNEKLEHRLDSEIISADSAYFGYIFETEDGLLVLNSSLENMWLGGEPVNWRVFPDTVDYVNHLHVVYDDHLSIHSFVQDYFIDQSIKRVGISFGVNR